ncbi:MAG TPA: BMP family ABC transporter substrate-binding protein [Acidimicrobiia bacterium]|jgi:basic membrane protein A|nr:BMP family ABC transporter substrate-binding protein [Acidimicrobiia bacterium]HIL06833.1 BMP family ABC transporter substrate-binding protein [Acidimicrobiia bacterium]
MASKWRHLLAVLAIFGLFTAAACSSDDGGGVSGGYTIGLVTDTGKVDDKSFNQSAWEGAQNGAGNILGATASYIETEESKDYANNIQLFLDDGAKIIVTVGFGLGGATIEAAQANPDVLFIGVDQWQNEALPNLVGLMFPEANAGFMAGALAGMLTETNIVGAVLGTDLVPPVVFFKEGWENGARYTNPEVQTISTYHPGGLDVAFGDPEWGATTARQALDQGADIIFGAGGATGNGALIEVAGEAGALCVGVDQDQWFTVPEAHPCLVTSAMKLINIGVAHLIAEAYAGTMEGGNYFGEVGLAPFHDFDGVVTSEMRSTLEEVMAGLADGSINPMP